MSFLPAQFFQEVRDETELAWGDRLLPLGALGRDESAFGHGLIGIGEKAFKSHLLKPFHHLLKTGVGQLGGTFHSRHSFKNLAIRFLIQMKLLFGDMNDRLFLPTDGHPTHYTLNRLRKGKESLDDIVTEHLGRRGLAHYPCFGEKKGWRGGQPKEEEMNKLFLLNSGYQNGMDV